jgi:MoCo/4Fe-4S cofactor protein with predicted Tat translocation signal
MNINPRKTMPLDLAAIRARLQTARGQQYWRSLEEVAASAEFQEWMSREFPPQASEWRDAISRRRLLQLMGASLALAGLSACTSQPEEKIMPYVRAPEEIVPGKPLFFATALPLGGIANGVLAESHMGRPTKIEGNPQHPASLGASDVFSQAAVLSLYDPDRSQVVSNAGRISTWNGFLSAIKTSLETLHLKKGKGLRVLSETVTSPTLAQQLQTLLETFPAAAWHQYEPLSRDAVRAGAHLAFGKEVNTIYRFDQAEVILGLETDFLSCGPGTLPYARAFAAKRRVRSGQTAMNRLYVVESTPSLTGVMADHRLPLRASEVAGFARTVAEELGILRARANSRLEIGPQTSWIKAVVSDLRQHRGTSLVLAGEQQPPVVHALAHAINYALGNFGHTVVYTDPVEAHPVDQLESLATLVADMEAGNVEILVILGGNPVYTAPSDFRFADHLAKVKLRIHLSLYEDETSALCHWHIPEAHALETWSDVRAYDGTVTIMQPLITPLYDGKSAHELLAVLGEQKHRSGHDIVRAYWQDRSGELNFEPFWRTALHNGLIADTARPLRDPGPPQVKFTEHDWPAAAAASLELVFRPDATIWDGRFANNGWLQELPKPLTKLTWDNAALISPATAERLGLQNGQVVELHYRGRMVRAPVWLMPGQVDAAVTVHLGYGRWRAGKVGTGTGFNAYTLRTSDAPWFGSGLELRTTDEYYALATTQHHYSMEGRHLIRAGTLEQFLAEPHFARKEDPPPPSGLTLYPPHAYEGYAWGMGIDLNACIGCGACEIACQAENNIPVVGKTEVMRGRAMHWLRIDRYYQGSLEHPETYHQVVLCMQCENAPCEVVCPVGATLHSSEGLNDMVYNRCVGTRYCSNNCPYKVRRFNFFQFADYQTPSLKLLYNPDVTVRSRGVMEKCTYCVQRINAARIEAEKENRNIRDGEVVTACQAACPTEAIVFGDINDPHSRVSRLKAGPLNYGLLTELNTRPRTTYLAKLRNPNPALAREEERHDRNVKHPGKRGTHHA